MRQFTSEEIQNQFEKLPAEVREAITSTEMNDKIEAVAKKHGLLIDQTGELVDEVGLVMLGLARSADFTSHMASRCSIDRKTALEIATDINSEVFNPIRQHLQKMEEQITPEDGLEQKIYSPNTAQKERDIAAVERAGEFEIVKDESDNDGGNGNDNGNEIGGGGGRYGKIWKDEEHTDPIVDHLLANTTATVTEKVTRIVSDEKKGAVDVKEDEEQQKGTVPANLPVEVKKQMEQPKEAGVKNKPYEKDPYREPIQ
ncbi:hypothetical protein KGQ27_00265 [Patescibacteria group bacterium]|nr:hypothetical protein [Patescibacteria group bacterium]MDE1946650.1 hypothetical protein [Patescibacteria group bacterium]MDE2010603.1 hypothetical protein [Patescibacteria group bacterium]MDE2232950.1 hypothetical protein [Patescibacteria group bacterium]